MKAITSLALSALIVASSMFAGQAAAGDYYGKQKVVYHINYDNPKQQAGALRNIQNHINAVGAENLDLKVAKGSEIAPALTSLETSGTSFSFFSEMISMFLEDFFDEVRTP